MRAFPVFLANTCQCVGYGMSTIDARKVAPQARVVMLSANGCGICRKARACFRRNGIRFAEAGFERLIR